MRVLLALTLCAIAAALEVPEVLPEWLFAERTVYLYEYRSLTATDLPQKSHQASGIETKAVLEVLVKEVDKTHNVATVQLRMVNVTTAWFDKEVMDLTGPVPNVYHAPHPEYEVYLQKWVYLKFAGTKVVAFYGTEGVPESVLNVYRAVATVLTLSNPVKPVPFSSEAATSPLTLDDEVVVYKLNEESLVGVCETVYHVHSVPKPVPGAVLNFTKVINPSKCLAGKVPTFKYAAYDSHGCPQACLAHKPLNVSKYYYPSNTEFYDPYDSGCPESFHPDTDVAESFLSVSYNVSTLSHKLGTLEGIKAIDKKVFVLGRQQLVTTSVLDLNLKLKAPLHVNMPVESLSEERIFRYYNLTYVYPTEHYVRSPAKLDLEYLSLFGPYNPEEVKRSVRELVTRLADLVVADDLSVKGETGELVVQLVEAVSTLKEEHLDVLFKTVVNKERIPEVSDKHYVERKVLVDVLSLAGTDSAAKFLLRLIAHNKLTLLESLHVLGALQGSLVDPSPVVLDKLQELLSVPSVKKSRVLYSTVAVTFAEIVKKHCVEYAIIVPLHVGAETLPLQPPSLGGKIPKCSKLQYEKYVKYVKTELDQAKDYPTKVVLIQTLARLNHPMALEALVPYVTGLEPSCGLTTVGKESPKEACQYLRQVAVYALHHSLKGHGLSIQPIVQDLYFNTTEDYELRLAAFNLFLATEPTEGQLMRVLLTLPHEENNQVASYVYSALLTVANSTLPCQQKTAVRVQQLLSALTEPLVYGVQYSKYHLYTQYTLPDNFGVKLQHDYVLSNISLVPRSLYTGATFSKGPYVASLYDVSVISKGLQKLKDLVSVYGGPSTFLSETISRIRRALTMKTGSPVPELDALLKALETSFTFNYESVLEEPKVTLATSFLGADYVLPLDKHYVLEVAKKSALYIKSIWHQPIHKRYTQVMLPYTYLKVSPAVTGLPVVQVARYPVVLSLSVKDLKLRLPKKGSVPDVFALAALVQPSVFLTGLTSSYTVTPLSKKVTGVKVQERTKATYPVDIAVQYSPLNRTVALTVRPRFTKVFEHTTKTFTFTAPAVLVGSRERPVVHQLTVIRPQLLPFEHTLYAVPKALGLGLHVQGYSSNPKLHVPVYLYPENAKKGYLAGLLEVIQNPLVHTRSWYVKIERHPEFPVDEYKLALRWNTTMSPLTPLKYLNVSEMYNHHYPHDLQVPVYDSLYEEYTGRLPPKYNLTILFKKIAAALEPQWLPVNPHLQHLVKNAENTTHSYLLEFVAAALGPREVKATVGHLYHGEVFDRTLKLSQLYVDTLDHPLYVLLNASVARSPLPSPFYSNASEVAKHKLVATLVGEFEAEHLPPKQQFTLKAVAEPSDEQLYGMVLPNGTLYKPWFVVKCEEDKKKGLEVVSYACKKVFEYYTNLNQVDFKVILPPVVPAPWKNVTHCLVQFAKVKLYSNLYADYVNKTAEGKFLGKLVLSEKVPEYLLANITLETPHDETLYFRHLAIPRGLQLSLPYIYPEVLSAFLRKNYSAPLCLVGAKNLTTFDNVTIPLELKTSSKYLLVRENSDEPDFTVVVEKATPTSKILKVVLKNETLLVLKPSLDKKSYVVLVNSSAITVSAHVPHLIQYQPAYFSQVYLYVTEHLPVAPVLWLYVRDLGLLVTYDGVNVYVKTVLPLYHGRLTGLCGNSNGEYSKDLYGPEGCLYEEPIEFVNSYGFGVSFPSPKGPYVCPPGVAPRHGNVRSMIGRAIKTEYPLYESDEEVEEVPESELPPLEELSLESKHITMERANRICISTEKVPVCKPGLEPVEQEKTLTGFVCLRKKSPQAKVIVKQIQMSENPTVFIDGTPKPNYHQEVDVPKVCM